MQGRPAHQLDIEVAHAKGPGRSLADCCKSLRQEVIELLTVLVARTEPVCLLTEFGVREGLE